MTSLEKRVEALETKRRPGAFYVLYDNGDGTGTVNGQTVDVAAWLALPRSPADIVLHVTYGNTRSASGEPAGRGNTT